MRTGFSYVVRTDLPPEAVTRIGIEIFALWLDFALGGAALNGRRLIYPSGRYASSLRLEQRGPATVAIIADEDVAPEAAILETGHRSFDMKTVTKLSGRALPLHRSIASAETARTTGLRRVGAGPPSLRPSMWAELHASTESGFASFGPNSPAGSWIIPPMPAYAPAYALAVLAKRMAAGG
jgi:hypothetical protein